ncbi:hypothetical protein TREES_T100010674 [Tupaia chinensis]|uniref:Uncharacterized protein n=1 Tax=Tupaia chinensis TaxID=246437 RepID=L9KPZ2_TUPCH|nr:hypothetical protein TREES_T100010674 [Tupaia chinensis]
MVAAVNATPGCVHCLARKRQVIHGLETEEQYRSFGNVGTPSGRGTGGGVRKEVFFGLVEICWVQQMFVTATEVVSQETEWHPLGRASQASVQSGSSSRRSIINNSGFLAPLQVTDSELVEEEFSQVPWTVLSIGHVWKLSP